MNTTPPAAPTAAPRPAQREEERGAKKFGCVLFDDEKEPGAAWAAVNGGEAKRIEGINELATDTIWWSNMTYESFFRATEAWRNPWLRHDAYLVVKPKDVLQEWGYPPDLTGPDFTASFASSVFASIMRMAYRLAKECEPRTRMDTLFVGTTLREDLRRLLPEAEYPKGEAATIMKTGQAYAEFTRTTVRGIKGAKVFVLRRPRVSYAMEMLMTPIPKGPFEYLGRQDLRELCAKNQSTDRVAWVRGVERPCLVEVAVQQMEADIAPVYGFGNSTDKDKRVPRSWVAHPEFLVMSAFSDLEVRSVWIGKEYTMLNKDWPEPVARFLADKYTEFSWSAGVIAETLWRAAALGEERGRVNKNVPIDERAHTSWRGAWIKAADKTAMFLAARQLTEMGYSTVSYGLGWVSCLVLEDQVQDLIADALTLGLVPKLADVPEGMFEQNQQIPWGGDQRAQMLAQLTMTKEKDMLWNLNKLPLYEPEQRGPMIKKLLQARQSRKL
jgi:hypothetical protein